jgi:hypothetical protein
VVWEVGGGSLADKVAAHQWLQSEIGVERETQAIDLVPCRNPRACRHASSMPCYMLSGDAMALLEMRRTDFGLWPPLHSEPRGKRHCHSSDGHGLCSG